MYSDLTNDTKNERKLLIYIEVLYSEKKSGEFAKMAKNNENDNVAAQKMRILQILHEKEGTDTKARKRFEEKVGLNKGRIYDITDPKRKTIVRVHEIHAIARIYGVSPNYIIYGIEDGEEKELVEMNTVIEKSDVRLMLEMLQEQLRENRQELKRKESEVSEKSEIIKDLTYSMNRLTELIIKEFRVESVPDNEKDRIKTKITEMYKRRMEGNNGMV